MEFCGLPQGGLTSSLWLNSRNLHAADSRVFLLQWPSFISTSLNIHEISSSQIRISKHHPIRAQTRWTLHWVCPLMDFFYCVWFVQVLLTYLAVQDGGCILQSARPGLASVQFWKAEINYNIPDVKPPQLSDRKEPDSPVFCPITSLLV